MANAENFPAPILALDQGTSSSRALIYAAHAPAKIAQVPLARAHLPQSRARWVEQDPEAIWQTSFRAMGDVLKAYDGKPPVAMGITNQRETTILWERKTGKPIYNAIVWQDRRTESFCQHLREKGWGEMISQRTGLVIDSYFSATKIKWILDEVEGAREKAHRGDLLFGTVESFLIYRLTEGRVHATDATNAARTSLFNIHTNVWDEELLGLFDVPPQILPQVYNCADDFGAVSKAHFGQAIPIRAAMGDQQAAAVGQNCLAVGQAKSTYGTGCFLLSHTGKTASTPDKGLLTTIAFRLENENYYATEGSIFMAGAMVQWLRDKVGLIQSAQETEALAAAAQSGVYFVPALNGLGAPYWDRDAQGAFFGLTQGTGRAEMVRACLEAVAYQTCDLLDAMTSPPKLLRVDGGMAANNWLMQCIADISGVPVERPADIETTARGAAVMAAVGAKLYSSLSESAGMWQREARFEPKMECATKSKKRAGWATALTKVLTRV